MFFYIKSIRISCRSINLILVHYTKLYFAIFIKKKKKRQHIPKRSKILQVLMAFSNKDNF